MQRRFPTWLLIPLVAILPLRGALAAVGMFCHVDSTGLRVATATASGHTHGATHQHDDAGRHAVMPHQHAAVDAEGNDDRAASPYVAFACPFCASVCGSPPVPATEVSLPLLLAGGSLRFPTLGTPRVDAPTGGVERPPRTI